MAGKNTGLQRTYKVGDAAGIEKYRGVTYGVTEGYVIKPAADNAIPVGIVDNDERIAASRFGATGDQTGRNIAVHMTGYADCLLSGSVAYGERLILAAGGAVKAMPDGVGVLEVATLTVTAACTTSGDVSVTLGGVATPVAVVDTDITAAAVATKIQVVLDALPAFVATVDGAVVTITAAAKGALADASFSGGDTGVTATVVTTVQGAADNSGVYNVVGFAEKAGVNGDVIPVRIAYHSYDVE
jgi:hypothetical protein